MGFLDLVKKAFGSVGMEVAQEAPSPQSFDGRINDQREKIRIENEFIGLCSKSGEPFSEGFSMELGYTDWNDVPILNDGEIHVVLRKEMDEYLALMDSIKLDAFKLNYEYFGDRAIRIIKQCTRACRYALIFKTYHQLIIIHNRNMASPSYQELKIPPFDPFVKLAGLYEKRKEYEKAIDVCSVAIEMDMIEDWTKGKFPGRLEKLIRKCTREGIDLSRKTIPEYTQSDFEEKRLQFARIEQERAANDAEGHARIQRINEEITSYRDDIDSHYASMYDLNSVAGIEAIPVKPQNWPPNQKGGIGTPVGNIDYVLRMKAGSHCNNGRMDLAIACFKKAQAIMPSSDVGWSLDDYIRLVVYLIIDGQFEEAQKELAEVRRNKYHLPHDPDFYLKYDDEWFESEKHRAIERQFYESLQKALPDIAPKSYSGYRRMKLNNTANYQKLMKVAYDNGFTPP